VLATKALHSVVNRLDQFDGRNVSRYIRFYTREMELSRVSEEEMVASFEPTVIPEIRERVHECKRVMEIVGSHLFKH
jgi:hypothetical protein